MGNAEYMGTPQPTMAATQILVALCVVGSAVAAPQISLGRSRSAGTNINENQVVTSVITSLTPSISKAVEEALAAAAAAEQAAAEQAAAEEAAAAAAEAERIKAAQAAQAEAARRQQIAAANAAAAAAAAEKMLLTPKSALTLVPWLTQFTTLNTKWRTMKRELTSQGTRRGTAMSFPAPTPSLMLLEHWSLSTTPPV